MRAWPSPRCSRCNVITLLPKAFYLIARNIFPKTLQADGHSRQPCLICIAQKASLSADLLKVVHPQVFRIKWPVFSLITAIKEIEELIFTSFTSVHSFRNLWWTQRRNFHPHWAKTDGLFIVIICHTCPYISSPPSTKHFHLSLTCTRMQNVLKESRARKKRRHHCTRNLSFQELTLTGGQSQGQMAHLLFGGRLLSVFRVKTFCWLLLVSSTRFVSHAWSPCVVI